MMQTVPTDTHIALPPHLAKCPICGAAIFISEMTAWQQDEADGAWVATEISLECETEPDLDDDDWEDWHNWHYQMPYVDWLPLTEQVLAWLKKHYRFEIGEVIR